MKTRDIMREIVADKVVLYEKMRQEAASDQERHDANLTLQALTEVLRDVDKVLDSVPYT